MNWFDLPAAYGALAQRGLLSRFYFAGFAASVATLVLSVAVVRHEIAFWPGLTITTQGGRLDAQLTDPASGTYKIRAQLHRHGEPTVLVSFTPAAKSRRHTPLLRQS